MFTKVMKELEKRKSINCIGNNTLSKNTTTSKKSSSASGNNKLVLRSLSMVTQCDI